MNKQPIWQALRLGLSFCACFPFFGSTLTTGSEESDGCSGHNSGTLTLINKSQYDANITMAGPVVTVEHVSLGGSKTINLRSRIYHWIANFVMDLDSLPENGKWPQVSLMLKKTKTAALPSIE